MERKLLDRISKIWSSVPSSTMVTTTTIASTTACNSDTNATSIHNASIESELNNQEDSSKTNITNIVSSSSPKYSSKVGTITGESNSGDNDRYYTLECSAKSIGISLILSVNRYAYIDSFNVSNNNEEENYLTSKGMAVGDILLSVDDVKIDNCYNLIDIIDLIRHRPRPVALKFQKPNDRFQSIEDIVNDARMFPFIIKYLKDYSSYDKKLISKYVLLINYYIDHTLEHNDKYHQHYMSIYSKVIKIMYPSIDDKDNGSGVSAILLHQQVENDLINSSLLELFNTHTISKKMNATLHKASKVSHKSFGFLMQHAAFAHFYLCISSSSKEQNLHVAQAIKANDIQILYNFLPIFRQSYEYNHLISASSSSSSINSDDEARLIRNLLQTIDYKLFSIHRYTKAPSPVTTAAAEVGECDVVSIYRFDSNVITHIDTIGDSISLLEDTASSNLAYYCLANLVCNSRSMCKLVSFTLNIKGVALYGCSLIRSSSNSNADSIDDGTDAYYANYIKSPSRSRSAYTSTTTSTTTTTTDHSEAPLQLSTVMVRKLTKSLPDLHDIYNRLSNFRSSSYYELIDQMKSSTNQAGVTGSTCMTNEDFATEADKDDCAASAVNVTSYDATSTNDSETKLNLHGIVLLCRSTSSLPTLRDALSSARVDDRHMDMDDFLSKLPSIICTKTGKCVDRSSRILLDSVNATMMTVLFLAMLLEIKIVVISSSSTAIFVIVYYKDDVLIELLKCPMPYFIGVDNKHMVLQLLSGSQDDVLILNLDTITILAMPTLLETTLACNASTKLNYDINAAMRPYYVNADSIDGSPEVSVPSAELKCESMLSHFHAYISAIVVLLEEHALSFDDVDETVAIVNERLFTIACSDRGYSETFAKAMLQTQGISSYIQTINDRISYTHVKKRMFHR